MKISDLNRDERTWCFYLMGAMKLDNLGDETHLSEFLSTVYSRHSDLKNLVDKTHLELKKALE